MLIPSIDLMGGKAVQLERGREKKLEVDDVLGLAARFSRYGELAVIDLDRAIGTPDAGTNDALVRELCRRHACRVGGGVRTKERAVELVKWGARKVIVGTKASPEFFAGLPRDAMMAALDVDGDRVVTHGWTEKSDFTASEQARTLTPFVSGFLVTIVDREGMLGGTDPERLAAVRKATELPIAAAGGIASVEEIVRLHDAGFDTQLGMSIYTGRVTLTDAFVALTDFAKGGGLAPTVVRDEAGLVLMLAYSDAASLRHALDYGVGAYHSRSRNELWVKGATSGHTQRLVRADFDCDRDALCFTVEQTGPACHTGARACFPPPPGPDAPWDRELLATLTDRIAKAKPGSYSAKLASNSAYLATKLSEEADEVNRARTRDELRWEAADLVYHLAVRLAADGLTWDEVAAELRARRK